MEAKNIFKRAINLLPIWAGVGFLSGLYDLIVEQYVSDGFYFCFGILGITLVINYVFFGAMTLWHKVEAKSKA